MDSVLSLAGKIPPLFVNKQPNNRESNHKETVAFMLCIIIKLYTN